MTSEPIVTATDLRRRYGEGDAAVDALDGVSVSFERGRFAAIMGPSGSGKSTLMHILAGLDRPTSGSVVVDGTELADLDDDELTELRRDKLGFIFQFFNLLPVLIGGGEHRAAAVDRRPRPRPGVAEPADRRRGPRRPPHPPARPSSRAASSSAWPWPGRWCRSPAVVFADEPTGNLDSTASAEVLRLLRQAVDEFGQTVVMVTHEAHAAAYADRLVVLRDGKVAHDGEAGTEAQVMERMKDAG